MRASTACRSSVAGAAALVVVLLSSAVVWDTTGLLYLLPATMLAFVLLTRRYPGERALIALRGSLRKRRWERARSSLTKRPRVVTVAVHGGLLIARSLAVRPPPAQATEIA